VLAATRAVSLDDIVTGQYDGYRDDPQIKDKSTRTEAKHQEDRQPKKEMPTEAKDSQSLSNSKEENDKKDKAEPSSVGALTDVGGEEICPERKEEESKFCRDPGVAAEDCGPASESSETLRRLCRFLIRFDPPTLAMEWEQKQRVQTQQPAQGAPRKAVTRIRVEARELASERARKEFAEKLTQEHGALLASEHRQQVEGMLRLLANKALPVYRVGNAGSDVRTVEPIASLPGGGFLLAKERLKDTKDKWCIRLAAGGLVEQASAERCEPSAEELHTWIERAEKSCEDRNHSADQLLALNLKALAAQVADRQEAPKCLLQATALG